MTDDSMTNDKSAVCHLLSVICHPNEPQAGLAAFTTGKPTATSS